VLRDQRQFVDETPPGEPATAAVDSETDAHASEPAGYVIRFSDGERIPARGAAPHTTQKQNMGAAVDSLIVEHGLLDAIELPHFPPRGEKNCSINTEPKHPNGDDMRVPYELTNG